MSERLQEIKISVDGQKRLMERIPSIKCIELKNEEIEWLISEVERLQAENGKLHEMREIVANAHQDTLEKSQQKVERLEKALKEVKAYHRHSPTVFAIAKQALETEEKG